MKKISQKNIELQKKNTLNKMYLAIKEHVDMIDNGQNIKFRSYHNFRDLITEFEKLNQLSQ